MGEPPTVNRRGEGAAAEREAAGWLCARGYELLAVNVHTRAGELDIVALDGETLCFVEVKARRSDAYGSALEAVDKKKQARIARSAQYYLLKNPWSGECRFDVVGMDQVEGQWEITLVRNAFEMAP